MGLGLPLRGFKMQLRSCFALWVRMRMERLWILT